MTDYMNKLNNNPRCPNCNSDNIVTIVKSAITHIFMCRDCSQSFGIKWMSDNDIDKVKKTAEYRQQHPEAIQKKKNPWSRI